MKETELYPPVKAYLEGQGYEVKAEVLGCDVVARRGEEAPVVVELKTGFTLPLLLQGVDRLSVTDHVYVAFGLEGTKGKKDIWRRHRKAILKTCRRLGLGLIGISLDKPNGRQVEVFLDPLPYRPRGNKKRTGRLLREFETRVGDGNVGGSTRRTLMTAYRQDALRCAKYVHANGEPVRLADMRRDTEVSRAGPIVRDNHYGWFERVDRGVYTLSPKGVEALEDFAQVLEKL